MRVIALVLTGLAAGFVPNEADACSCNDPLEFVRWPQTGAMAPRTTDVWFGVPKSAESHPSALTPDLVLVGPSGLVEVRHQVITGRDAEWELHRLEPTSDLEAGPHSVQRGVEVIWTFTVEDQSDDEHALALTARRNVVAGFEEPQSSCGPILASRFEFDGTELPALRLVKLEGLAVDLDLDHVELLALEPHRHPDDALHLGAGFCLTGGLRAEPGSTMRLAFGSLDMSGNFSGWTDAVDVRVPTEDDASGPTELPIAENDGCSAVSTGSLTPLAFLLWPLLVRRKRSKIIASRA